MSYSTLTMTSLWLPKAARSSCKRASRKGRQLWLHDANKQTFLIYYFFSFWNGTAENAISQMCMNILACSDPCSISHFLPTCKPSTVTHGRPGHRSCHSTEKQVFIFLPFCKILKTSLTISWPDDRFFYHYLSEPIHTRCRLSRSLSRAWDTASGMRRGLLFVLFCCFFLHFYAILSENSLTLHCE